MLRELDVKETPNGKQTAFSVVFVSQSGQRIFLPRAVSCGLPYSLKTHRLRGLLPVDSHGDKSGHVYPVSIDNILEYNSMEVVL